MQPPTCETPGCGRPTHARGYCKSHADSPWRDIRPYKARESGLVLCAGLRVTELARAKVQEVLAAYPRMSPREVAGKVLEGWAGGFLWAPRPRAPLPAAGALVALLAVGAVAIRCGYPPRAEAARGALELTKPLPARALPGQLVPPCKEASEAMNGACWNPIFDKKTRGQLRDCEKSELYFQSPDGFCWEAAYPKPSAAKPPSVIHQ